MVKDAAGNVYFCGDHRDSLNIGGIGLTPGEGGAFLGKLDVYGNLVWMHQFGCPVPNSDFGYGVDVDQSGNVYVCGKVDGLQTAHFGALTIANGSNGFVAKYNTAGTLLKQPTQPFRLV